MEMAGDMDSSRIEAGAKAELRDMVLTGKLQGKIVYAMGNIFNISAFDDILREFGLYITAIVDNDPDMVGERYINGKAYETVSADCFFQRRNEKTVLLIYSVRFWCEMREQMVRHGMKEDGDFYVLESPTLFKKRRYVEKGYSLLRDIRREYGENAYILVFHGPLGDNYFFSLFYLQYLQENGISNCVCLGVASTERINKLFGLPNFRRLEKEELLALEYLYMFLGEKLKRVKILQIWDFTFHFNRCRIRFDRRFNFMDTYRDYIYHLQKNREPIQPTFCMQPEKITAVFRSLGMEKGKTIIISPYAYSISLQPPQRFWIRLIERLKEKGMKAVLNINPESEENFSSVPALTFPIEESVPYLEYAGSFIGMRSGFCDITSSAICKKILLYPKADLTKIDYNNHRPDKQFSSLKEMGLFDDAIELEFEQTATDQYWNCFVETVVQAWENT